MAGNKVPANQIPVACFAPPLTDEKLAEYQALIDSCQDIRIKDAMTQCMSCVKAWWELPVSSRRDFKTWSIGRRNESGQMKTIEYNEIPLEEDHIKALDVVTPWDTECTIMGDLFDRIKVGDPLRDAAFHLLWFCKEITRDREPLTADVLGS